LVAQLSSAQFNFAFTRQLIEVEEMIEIQNNQPSEWLTKWAGTKRLDRLI